ncbi:uncharacterized protein LOC124120159 [Haliotis rufescens]|uniref:uncharacterized protein LOC124120159 n=1 Tax=Haliotis rufescens TaxID=6454 RepID=UPI00201EFCC7|nr:uncharacterized protein LOC124120159 [Haliotis rufescens]XP_046338850.2 uncharacterized protein LOC124120159 [Haliotis rufescens]
MSEETRSKVISYSPSNRMVRHAQSMSSEETRPKTLPDLPNRLPHHTPPISGTRGLSAIADFQPNRSPYHTQSTSSVATNPTAMAVYSPSIHLPRHIKTSSEETLPKAVSKCPPNLFPHHTQSPWEETCPKDISMLPITNNSMSSDTRPLSVAASPPPRHATATPTEGRPTVTDIPAKGRGRLTRAESIQLGDHNDIYKIAQMTDFKDANINKVEINNHYYQAYRSKSDGIYKYVNTESDSRIEVTNRYGTATDCDDDDGDGGGGGGGGDGSAADAGSYRGRLGRRGCAEDLEHDSYGPMKKHKADPTETSLFTTSDRWQKGPERNIRMGSSTFWADGTGQFGSVNDDFMHSQCQRSRDGFLLQSSYEKREMTSTSDGGTVTLQKCSESIVCITDSVKIFDSDGEMVREGDVLYIECKGGYYGVYVGHGAVTFVEADGRVTTKRLDGNLTSPIATEGLDGVAGYHRLKPLQRSETSRRAKELIGHYYQGSGEDFVWFCRYNVPLVPR